MPSMNVLGTASANAMPISVPTTAPTTTPNTDTITASHRTARRNCRRLMPTARSSPISRVRSNTDSASVMAMPKNEIMMAKPSRPEITIRSWSIWPS